MATGIATKPNCLLHSTLTNVNMDKILTVVTTVYHYWSRWILKWLLKKNNELNLQTRARNMIEVLASQFTIYIIHVSWHQHKLTSVLSRRPKSLIKGIVYMKKVSVQSVEWIAYLYTCKCHFKHVSHQFLVYDWRGRWLGGVTIA